MPRPIDPEERWTYEEWLAFGYQVQRGERHVDRDTFGRPVFSSQQVRPRSNNPALQLARNTYQQRPRRVRAHERGEQPQEPVRNDPQSVTLHGRLLGSDWETATWPYQQGSTFRAYTSGDYFYNGDYPRVVSRAVSRAVERFRVEVAPPAAPPTPNSDAMGVWEAEIAYTQAKQAVVRLQQGRKYVPEDDESSNGFKKLSAFERAIKEKSK